MSRLYTTVQNVSWVKPVPVAVQFAEMATLGTLGWDIIRRDK